MKVINNQIRKKILNSEDIIELFNNKTIDYDWSFKEYKPSMTGKWTHSYHRYPAKFIPQLVEKLLDEYVKTNKPHVNDPFYGSGTTIVTAISRGYISSGTDINKIAYLITKVKATPIDPEYLNFKLNKFISNLEDILDKKIKLFNNSDIDPLIPEKHLERINYWFPEDIKIELGKILRMIINEDDEKIRNFLLVAFSHILKTCSIWLQGSTKPTRDFNKKITSPFIAFKKHIFKMQKGNNEFYRIVDKNVKNNIKKYLNIKIGDAKKQPVKENSVDIVITSSPYVTSYEYADLHQLSTIWFDFADDLLDYKKKFIGTSYKSYNNEELKSFIGRSIVNKMYNKNKKIAKEIEAFFIDMQKVFNESYRILKYGGRACYVIGNTKLKGIDILNAQVFVENLQFSGFTIDRIIKREIPSKILPQNRDEKTGKFTKSKKSVFKAYPIEYIVIAIKE